MNNLSRTRSGTPQHSTARTIALGAALLATAWVANSAAATKIYKTVDADGNVVYTDVAPTQREAESELQVEELNTFENPQPSAAELPVVVLHNDEDPDNPAEIPAYSGVKVASPSNDEAVRANDGNISLGAVVEPQLHSTHQVRFFLDGKPVGTVHGLSLPLSNVDRGSHQAKVAVMDGSGNVLLESAPVTFHVLRYFKPKS